MHNSSPERTLHPDAPDYPARLLELSRPPAPLFARGTLAIALPPAVAIVGTRAATPYGVRVTRAIATACARAGVCVVSGLARGIDATAHQAALAAGGRTVAVLGTATNMYYPRGHRGLQEQIARDGLLLSEVPLGGVGHKGTFPERNRIIAALADITVVVEAGEESGALITARHAHALGRTVASVPNAIDVPTAVGSNRLLKEHAEPILEPADVLSLLRMKPSAPHGPALDGAAAQCWDALQHGACEVATIAAHAGMSSRDVVAVLAALEIDGLITFDAGGRVRPALFVG
jgi:DNA processing protein